ncbi:MAG: P1 family peptidase [Anaerolineae bacterium]
MNQTFTAVPGIRVGHWTDLEAATGCTVVLCADGATAGVAVRGGGPGTRETDLLRPETLVQQVHAVVLSGGSAFGLAAADGVMRWLEEHDIGFDVGVTKVPIVPAAILFDLMIGRHDVRPDAEAGYAACQAATADPVAEGNVGAGAGATVGKLMGALSAMKGGLGSATVRLGNGVVVGALAVVNCLGDVIDPDTGEIVAGARSPDGGWLDTAARLIDMRAEPQFGNTTLAVVATDAQLTQAQCTAVANMAHTGLARVVQPAHTLMDGDTIFALSVGDRQADVSAIGTAAAEAVSRAILQAVEAAETLHNIPARSAVTAS